MPSLLTLIALFLLVVMPIGWFLLTWIVGMFEVYRVWPYEPLDEYSLQRPASFAASNNPYASPLSAADQEFFNAYGRQCAEDLGADGFRMVGLFQDARGGLYQVHYVALISPASDVLAIIGWGKIAKIPLNGTWLFTLLADGTCILTIDNQSGTHHDLTGMTHEAVFPNVPTQQLLTEHRSRVADQSVPVMPFSPDEPLKDLQRFRMQRAETLVERNYARFANPTRSSWRYTFFGSFRVTVFMYWSQLKPRKKQESGVLNETV